MDWDPGNPPIWGHRVGGLTGGPGEIFGADFLGKTKAKGVPLAGPLLPGPFQHWGGLYRLGVSETILGGEPLWPGPGG